ncbi:MAG: N-methyl-L-tryptophan oxidase [Candidatus Elarobacter sp.]
MSARYDAIVLGLGGMGSAVAAHAAARGLRVLGLEQFGPVHALGASHGRTRIIRQAYFESPLYVPMLQRAYALWDALEARTRMTLRAQCGGLFVGTPSSPVVAGAVASGDLHGLPYELLDPAEIRRRFPATRPRDDEVAVFEAVAGAVFPEAGVHAHLLVAAAEGAELRFGARVLGWDAGDSGVEVTLAGGERIEAARLAICAGPWFARIAPDVGMPIRVERNVQFWFAPADPSAVAPDRLPIFCVQHDERTPMFYGFPDFGHGAKVAYHGSGVDADPDALDRTVRDDEIAHARAALASFVPAAAGRYLDAAACLYALTPDEHFALGRHPRNARVAIAGGFSGHGYKFTPVVGAIVAALLAGDDPGFDLSLFAPGRFAAAAS